MPDLIITYLNGPTALLEVAGLRLLTDPTFDPAGTSYPTPAYTLRKTTTPAAPPQDLLPLTAVLLSHDHHVDNLDEQGRAMLPAAPRVFTTQAAAERLGGNAMGLAPGESAELPTPNGGVATVTATPARHGPPGGDRGPVIGFVLRPPEGEGPVVYVSGDTVWYGELVPLAARYGIQVACLNLGAAKVQAAGPHPLTFTADDAAALARAWPHVPIVPLHFEGWEHFSEGRAEVEHAFEAAGLSQRLKWCEPGQRRRIEGPGAAAGGGA